MEEIDGGALEGSTGSGRGSISSVDDDVSIVI